MRVLFLGDVVASAGRRVVRQFVSKLREREALDFVIANGENASAGQGIDEKTASELFSAGVDVITGGNHSWDKKEALTYIEREPYLLRPANYPDIASAPVPGRGYLVIESRGARLGVVNIMGLIHMQPQLDCPFRSAENIISLLEVRGVKHILVDFHAEATSEKQAFGHYLAGKVSAVVGSHSHVQTADERILKTPNRINTAYITDAGMTGPYDSVIGMVKERSISRFLTKMPVRYEPADGMAGLHGVIIDIDDATGSAKSIRRISMFEDIQNS